MRARTRTPEEFEVDLSLEHLREKEKRCVSMKRQKNHKRQLLNALSHSRYRPSICRAWKWDKAVDEYIETNIIKRQKSSQAQRFLKKTSKRLVRRLCFDALPAKGNSYRKAFDYWWTWV